MQLRICAPIPDKTSNTNKTQYLSLSNTYNPQEHKQYPLSFLTTQCFRRAAYLLADSLLPATCITYRNLYLWGVFCFAEEGHQATQGGLKLSIWSRLTLNCSSSCLRLPGIGFTGVCHHAHLSVAFFEFPLCPFSPHSSPLIHQPALPLPLLPPP